MTIEEFPLAWRWLQSSHGQLSQHTLDELRPLDPAAVLALTSKMASASQTVFSQLTADNADATRQWLQQLGISSQRVTVVWAPNVALSLPWLTFCQYWDDFCYPSSDDANIFLACGRLALRWHHYEVFEYDPEFGPTTVSSYDSNRAG